MTSAVMTLAQARGHYVLGHFDALDQWWGAEFGRIGADGRATDGRSYISAPFPVAIDPDYSECTGATSRAKATWCACVHALEMMGGDFVGHVTGGLADAVEHSRVLTEDAAEYVQAIWADWQAIAKDLEAERYAREQAESRVRELEAQLDRLVGAIREIGIVANSANKLAAGCE